MTTITKTVLSSLFLFSFGLDPAWPHTFNKKGRNNIVEYLSVLIFCLLIFVFEYFDSFKKIKSYLTHISHIYIFQLGIKSINSRSPCITCILKGKSAYHYLTFSWNPFKLTLYRNYQYPLIVNLFHDVIPMFEMVYLYNKCDVGTTRMSCTTFRMTSSEVISYIFYFVFCLIHLRFIMIICFWLEIMITD